MVSCIVAAKHPSLLDVYHNLSSVSDRSIAVNSSVGFVWLGT